MRLHCIYFKNINVESSFFDYTHLIVEMHKKAIIIFVNSQIPSSNQLGNSRKTRKRFSESQIGTVELAQTAPPRRRQDPPRPGNRLHEKSPGNGGNIRARNPEFPFVRQKRRVVLNLWPFS